VGVRVATRRDPESWIPWVRLLAVPVVIAEVAVEHGNYPPGDERWAWALTAVLGAGAIGFIAAQRRTAHLRVAGLVFDLVVVSTYVILYSFELGTPVRLLLVLPVIEAGLCYGVVGGLLGPLACVPALAVFEWRQAVRLDLYPFDAGHVIGPFGLLVFVGLVVGTLAGRGRAAS
jgi:hypothetical protein